MSIVILGAYGQLGTALEATAYREVISLPRQQADLAQTTDVCKVLDSLNPEIVINCAAYNQVDQAQVDLETAKAINTDAPGILAEWCDRRDAVFVHFSTDYVFGGDLSRRTPYTEQDPPAPLSIYGETKLAGECAIQAASRKYFILRTCGLYGARRSTGKGNFVETMLKLAETRDELNVVDDQECTPTSATDLARWTWALIETSRYGLYHATNSGSTTWCRMAREIVRLTHQSTIVRPITSEEFGAAAPRPHYSVLDCSQLEEVIQIPILSWQTALESYLTQR
ncbi:MAG: dTDP-4-dehydrorhamnose reductase [Planctomycetaceae bacterium]|nr:dTDP-4-dehydrorhamnose reductase [Planctomycetaceae bacterium]